MHAAPYIILNVQNTARQPCDIRRAQTRDVNEVFIESSSRVALVYYPPRVVILLIPNPSFLLSPPLPSRRLNHKTPLLIPTPTNLSASTHHSHLQPYNPSTHIRFTHRRKNLSTGQHLTGLFLLFGSSILQSYCSISSNSHAFKSPLNPFRFVPFRLDCEAIGSSEAGKVAIGGAMTTLSFPS